jgi:hypothetical protein
LSFVIGNALAKQASAPLSAPLGSAKGNGREPKTCSGQVFSYKLGLSMMCMYLSMWMHAHIYS